MLELGDSVEGPDVEVVIVGHMVAKVYMGQDWVIKWYGSEH